MYQIPEKVIKQPLLSATQMRILAFVCSNQPCELTNEELAGELFLSESAVSVALGKLYKLNLLMPVMDGRNRTDLLPGSEA
jgi:DNA-binding MarR family transcriptional regulator